MGFGLWVLGWSHFAVKVTTETRRRNGALWEFKFDLADDQILIFWAQLHQDYSFIRPFSQEETAWWPLNDGCLPNCRFKELHNLMSYESEIPMGRVRSVQASDTYVYADFWKKVGSSGSSEFYQNNGTSLLPRVSEYDQRSLWPIFEFGGGALSSRSLVRRQYSWKGKKQQILFLFMDLIGLVDAQGLPSVHIPSDLQKTPSYRTASSQLSPLTRKNFDC